MAAYMAVISAKFRMLLQYRAAAIGGMATQSFFGLIIIMVMESFYGSTQTAQPISLSQIIGYVWLGQAFWSMLPWNPDAEVRGIIRSGAVAYELLRPIDLYNLWFSRAMAARMAPTLLRAVPIFLFAALVLPAAGLGEWGLHAPRGWGAAAGWAAAMVGALLLSCAITMLVNICLLWSVGADAVSMLLAAAVTIFSGMVIPLPLFPEWAQAVLRLLPFAGIVDTPYRLYTGNYPASQALPLVALQLAWVAALVLLGRWLLGRATRRLVVQGG
jgi:ABC-2 type transport system permease protein